jgi:hypothetical protein
MLMAKGLQRIQNLDVGDAKRCLQLWLLDPGLLFAIAVKPKMGPEVLALGDLGL